MYGFGQIEHDASSVRRKNQTSSLKKEPDDAILIISFSVMSVQEDIMLFVLGVICVLDVIGFLVVVEITVYVPLIVILLVFYPFLWSYFSNKASYIR